MPKLREFYIDEAYLCDITVFHEGNTYTDHGRVPTAEETLELLKGKGGWRTVSHEDHPEFAKLRQQLEDLGYIKIERSWSNGDRVTKAFKLNGFIFSKGIQFSCATAMGNNLYVRRKHPKHYRKTHW